MKYFEEIRRLKSLQKAETYLDRRVTSGGGGGGGEVSSALFQNLKKSALNLGKNALTSELMPKRTSTVRIFCEFT